MAENTDIGLEEFPGIIDEEFDIPSRKEPQIYFSDDLIAIYTAFCDQVYRPQSVLYPSCAFDASPARVFDNVTFVDIENGSEGCVRKLQEAGLQAIKQDIKTYTPEDLHDLLILLNPTIPTEWASRHLKSGGYVIANNYHGNASEMYHQPDQFNLWGTIDFVEKDRRKGDNRVVVSRNLGVSTCTAVPAHPTVKVVKARIAAKDLVFIFRIIITIFISFSSLKYYLFY